MGNQVRVIIKIRFVSHYRLYWKGHRNMSISCFQQYITYTKNEEIVVEDNCFDYANSQPSNKVKMLDCHSMKGNQQWLHSKVRIQRNTLFITQTFYCNIM